MTMPPLPALGDTSWRGDWAQAVHDAATEVVQGRLTEAAQRAAFGSPVIAVGPGLDPTGVTDSTAAVQALIDGLPVGGGRILFPGIFRIDGELNADETKNVVLAGWGPQGVDRVGPWNSELRFTKGGSTPCISARASQGFTIDSLAVRNTNVAFIGDIIDTGSSGDPTPTYRPTFRNGFVGGAGGSVVNARSAIFLGQSVEGFLDQMVIGMVQTGLIGRDATQAGFCTAVSIHGGRFVDIVGDSILNPHAGWNLYGVVFENATDNTPSGIRSEPSLPGLGVNLFGCEFWDATAAGVWIDYYGDALSLFGSYVETADAGITYVRLNGTVRGFRSSGGLIRGGPATVYVATANSPVVTSVGLEDAFINGATDNGDQVAGLTFHQSRSPVLRVRTVTADTALTAADYGSMILVNATAGPIAITMPAPNAEGAKGSSVAIKKVDNTANAVTIGPQSGPAVDYGYSFTLAARNNAVTFVASGTEPVLDGGGNVVTPGGWHSIGKV